MDISVQAFELDYEVFTGYESESAFNAFFISDIKFGNK